MIFEDYWKGARQVLERHQLGIGRALDVYWKARWVLGGCSACSMRVLEG